MNHELSRREWLALSSAALATGLLHGEEPAAKHLMLIAGRPSHGPGSHEFNAGVHILALSLARVPGLRVSVHSGGWPTDEKAFDTADGILVYADGGGGHPFIQQDHLKKIGALMDRGVGLMAAHFGVEVPKDKGANEFRDWIGGCYEHEWSCNPMWIPEFTEFPQHPITRGVKPFAVQDEWYINLRFRPEMKGITPLLSAAPSDQVRNGPYVYPRGPYKHIQDAKGKSEVMMWSVERADGGRGVGFTGGHFHKNWMEPNFRKIVLNALLWITKIEVPEAGVESVVTETDMKAKLDPKGK